MQDSKPGDGDAPGSIEGGEKTDTPSSASRAHLLHRKEVPPNALSLTHFEFQFLTQTLTTSQSAQTLSLQYLLLTNSKRKRRAAFWKLIGFQHMAPICQSWMCCE